MAYTIDLSGKVAIVTGGVKVIGEATAQYLARAGAQVVICDLMQLDGVQKVLAKIGQDGLQPFYLQADISEQANADNLVQNVLEKFGRVDILINNAGVVADWDKSFAVHVKGVYYCSNAVKNHMAERGSGRIVNLTSTCVFTGGTGIPEYVASKGGTYSLTRYLAKTYAPLGILVNGVMPAVIMSDMIMTRYKTKEEMIQHYTPLMPVKRIGYPDDVAGVILFLCSDLSRFVCGEVIVVDGGRLNVGG
jgi:NAD(P)-dependent dehydrogenase (short-subunit alcohol dehydrogenase family)